MSRISVVKQITVNEVGLGSTLFVGDLVEVKPRSKALAIQREVANFYGNEGNLDSYAIFSRPIPIPSIYEDVKMEICSSNPFIKVGTVDILSISSSSLLQVGSNRTIDAETRTKHIRQLLPKDKKGK
ncbi:spore germination protein GerPE [Paenibacillus contaminans]|uniref:Spore germination protein GerPE n=1 Tax=Paenibacillus contaminans TaxID=450362 RepID=A0A329MXP2_9BACL|nr:spore germination protein GerPE [Paenibacillus contaminans]RAV22507.1 spore germination protein GerPE [Paenibacillus contaminans]